ncbi:MAG: lipoprotein [Chthoniobacteraceae bacterium]|nr:lipoprotein [Chthoniobacteraceae bacterium]
MNQHIRKQMTPSKLIFTSLAVIAVVASATALILAADKNFAIPGNPETAKTKLLEAGAEMLQSEAPLKAIHAHVCGLHFYNGKMGRQLIAHHYCSRLSDDLLQCVIYDTDKKDARLIGIEYIVSANVFATLSEEEKKLWHSHVYEVKSGALTGPGLPEVAEKELMKSLIGTYGKTWHTWQVGDRLPLGIPQLMMGFTADGQINPKILSDRDRGYGISAEEKKRNRADIATPSIDPGANAWEKGNTLQLQAVPLKAGVEPVAK